MSTLLFIQTSFSGWRIIAYRSFYKNTGYLFVFGKKKEFLISREFIILWSHKTNHTASCNSYKITAFCLLISVNSYIPYTIFDSWVSHPTFVSRFYSQSPARPPFMTSVLKNWQMRPSITEMSVMKVVKIPNWRMIPSLKKNSLA